ncbi:MAG: tRNA epoxyqueuosine(34) reductase QueG [Chitinophagaceae bacterium]|nr:tRNA epoxyqueuosine(34) reductase QueG [Chitinophagaceae bacterium]MBL0056159.1 tRNA epoxyqueuosine(34) reductase QueG [Chitinophagaceae bacterium]
MTNLTQHTLFIKETAARLGFDFCGIARSQKLEEDARRLENWLHKGMHGSMQYMEKHFDLRIDPNKLVPGARSVITLMLNYFPAAQQPEPLPRISKYAYGQDYHEIIRNKLNHFMDQLRSEIGEVNGRGFVDSAPVLERAWAQRSGLGWIGRNGNLISKQSGSFFFIATLILDIELEYDNAFARDYCGTCTRCIDACPTDAILEEKVIDGSKCISYFTIELKDALIPAEMKGKFENWVFGCDICQDVCPWNRFSKPTSEEGFSPIPELLEYTQQDWAALTEEQFKKLFRHSPLKRAKFEGLRRNLNFILNEHES